MPYATKPSTLTGTFKNGVPTSVTVSAGGANIATSNFRATTLSGSGARTSGVYSVDVVLPAAGSVGLTVTPVGMGGNAAPGTFTAQVRAASESYQVPAAIPLGLMAHGATAPVGTLIESIPGFERNHLSPTQHLVVTVDGQSVQVQQDGEVPWSNGNVRTARTVWPMPIALTADTEKRMTVAVVAGAPNRTLHTTPQAIVAAHDYTVRASGGDLGATVLTASLRDIVTNFPRDDWGTNPLGGWDLYASGPYQVGIRGWRYVDGWRKLWLYVTANSDGTVDVAGLVTAPNWDGPVANAPAGATSTAVEHRVVCAVEMYQDGTRLGAWGGANDPRTATIAATTFGADNHLPTLPTGLSFGMCVSFAPAAGGTLSSGVIAGTPYWMGGLYSQAPWTLHSSRDNAKNATNPVVFGSAGSGNITVTPMLVLYAFSGVVLMGQDARPIRIGSDRVDMGVAWDEQYMARGAKLFPPYESGYTRYPANAAGDIYYPQRVPWGFNLNGYGDDPGDNRIGIVNQNALLALLSPYDKAFAQTARSDAASWGDQPIWIEDIASGRVLVCDNGPDNAGGRYPRLGASRPTTGWNAYAGGAGAATNMGVNAVNGDDYSAYADGYSHGFIEGSHLPNPWVVAAHQTGCPVFVDMAIGTAMVPQMYNNVIEAIGNKTYYNIVGAGQQLRGSGWVLRSHGFAEAFVPASRPEAALIKHALDDMAEWGALKVLTAPTSDLSMGRIGHLYPFDADVGFFFYIFMQCLALEVWRGDRPALRTYAAGLANMQLGMLNDASPTGGSGYVMDAYHPRIRDANGVTYPSIRAMIAAEGDLYKAVPPFPATGLAGNAMTIANYAFNCSNAITQGRCALALLASAGVTSLNGDDAQAVLGLLDARVNTAPCIGYQWSSTNWGGRFGGAPRSFPPWSVTTG